KAISTICARASPWAGWERQPRSPRRSAGWPAKNVPSPPPAPWIRRAGAPRINALGSAAHSGGDAARPGFQLERGALVLDQALAVKAIDLNLPLGSTLLQDKLAVMAEGRALRPVAT